MAQIIKTNEAPSQALKKSFENLCSLGDAIVAIRGDGFSGNFLGPISLGRDGGDQVITVGNCKCHIHVDWNRADRLVVEEENVGFGPEPVVRLLDSAGKPLVHFFYPRLSRKRIGEALFSL